MTNNFKSSLLILGIIAFVFTSCQKSNQVFSPNSVNEDVPEEIWSRFSTEERTQINAHFQTDESLELIFAEFELEYWEYPVYDGNGFEKFKSIPMIGEGIDNKDKTCKAVFNQTVSPIDAYKRNHTCDFGDVNFTFWNEQTNEQMMANIKVYQHEYGFQLEENLYKIYITNGTGSMSDISGYAYGRFTIETPATYGCFPNNAEYPDRYEDGTCALQNCIQDCTEGQGKVKFTIVGYTNS